MICFVKSARQKYQQSLVGKSKLNLNKGKSEEKKKKIISEIQEINTKVASLEKTVNELKNDADKYAFQAEKMNDLTILLKSNALKRASIDKEITLGELKSKKVKLLELKERIWDLRVFTKAANEYLVSTK